MLRPRKSGPGVGSIVESMHLSYADCAVRANCAPPPPPSPSRVANGFSSYAMFLRASVIDEEPRIATGTWYSFLRDVLVL